MCRAVLSLDIGQGNYSLLCKSARNLLRLIASEIRHSFRTQPGAVVLSCREVIGKVIIQGGQARPRMSQPSRRSRQLSRSSSAAMVWTFPLIACIFFRSIVAFFALASSCYITRIDLSLMVMPCGRCNASSYCFPYPR